MTSAQDWARFYVVKRGWALTPLHYMVSPNECSCPDGVDCAAGDGKDPTKSKAGKHPVKGSWTDPSTMIRTEEGVTQFWATRPWNIGLPTGQINRLVAIDIDPRNGGFNSLDEFESIRPGGPLPATLTAHTGGGGRHHLYALPAGVVIKKGPMHKDFPGIDIQAEGAQIVLPPSMHRSGIRYAWADGRSGGEDLAMLPEDLIDFLMKRRSGSGAGAAAGEGVDIEQAMRDGIPDGARNNILYKIACKLFRQFGTEPEQVPIVVGMVEHINQVACKPPMEGDDLVQLRASINSAWQYIANTPSSVDALSPETRAWLEARSAPTPTGGTPADVGGGGGGSEGPSPGAVAAVPARPADSDDAGGGGLEPPSSGPPDPDSLGDAQDGEHRSLTDNGNARRIVDAWNTDIRYTPAKGWFAWGGLHWDVDNEELSIKERARHLPVRVTSEIDPINWSVQQQTDHVGWANKSRSAAAIRNAVSLAASDPRILVPVDSWDADDWLLGVRNGVLDLRTGQLHEGTRDQYITKKTKITYDPNARDHSFNMFLRQVTNEDKEFADWLQLVAGYTLTGLTHHEKFFLIYGPQASGKSTFGAILAALLGDYSTAWASDYLTEQQQGNSQDYRLAELVGKRMVFVSEMPEAEQMKEDMVKRLTGGDKIPARAPGGRNFEFENHSKLWIATNHRPRVRDDATWRRMVAVPFMFKNLAPSADLKPHLLDPGAGLPAALAWAVEGAVRYARAGDFGMCSAVAEATAEYKRKEDRFGRFLEEECNVGEGYSVPFGQLHTAYKFWEEEGGLGRARGISIEGFENKVVDRGFTVTGKGKRREVEGVALVLRDVAPNPNGGTNFAELMPRSWG